MKNLLNNADRQEITARIKSLTSDHKALWGTMDISQMVTHCQRPIELALLHPKPKRSLLGYILGTISKSDVWGPKPFKRNMITAPDFKVTDHPDFESNKEKLIRLVERFPEEMPQAGLKHPFFGALDLEVWGQGQYKHLDHHLSQFGA